MHSCIIHHVCHKAHRLAARFQRYCSMPLNVLFPDTPELSAATKNIAHISQAQSTAPEHMLIVWLVLLPLVCYVLRFVNSMPFEHPKDLGLCQPNPESQKAT
eukprot:GHUV01007545.1.p3 GENE.GHUV01007545.1~~GHUV01007545.1.p3  ORF type:complete len:102 (-),score=1.76 GHUV01007545.1:1486-1791(-)